MGFRGAEWETGSWNDEQSPGHEMDLHLGTCSGGQLKASKCCKQGFDIIGLDLYSDHQVHAGDYLRRSQLDHHSGHLSSAGDRRYQWTCRDENQ